MQLSKVIVGKWYQTTQGIGQCLSAAKRTPPSVCLNILKPMPRGKVYLSPKDVQYELPKGEEPKAESSDEPGMVTGTLHNNDNKRWEIVYGEEEFDQLELTSGSVIEVQIGGNWIKTSIEHNGKDYYATESGIRLTHNMPARVKR